MPILAEFINHHQDSVISVGPGNLSITTKIVSYQDLENPSTQYAKLVLEQVKAIIGQLALHE